MSHSDRTAIAEAPRSFSGVPVREMEVTYGMKDGRKIVLPGMDLFRFNNRGLVRELKMYSDAGPLFQPPAT
jgi:hypothetical protein